MMSSDVVRSTPLPQKPAKEGETLNDLRHPFEETNSCLLYRWNTDLKRWEVWWNHGWKEASSNSKRDESFVPPAPQNDYDDRFVTYEVTWAEPYEEDVRP
jgi:hypothetical protein